MKHWKKNLEQREKSELIAIIQHMLGQEPELQWLLMTPLPQEALDLLERIRTWATT